MMRHEISTAGIFVLKPSRKEVRHVKTECAFFFLLFFFFKNTTDQTDLRCLLTVQIPGPLSGILSYNIRIPGDGIGWEF